MKLYSTLKIVLISTVASFAALLTSCTPFQITISPLGSGGNRQGPPPQMRGPSQGGSQMTGRPQGGSSGQMMAGRSSSGGQSGGQQRQVKTCPQCRNPLLPINGQRPTVCSKCRLDLRKAFGASGSSRSSGSCGRSTSSSGSSSSGFRPMFASSSGSSGLSSSQRSEARQEVYDYRSGVASEIKSFQEDHAGDPPTKSEMESFQSGLRSDAQSFRKDMQSQYGSRSSGSSSGSSSSCRRPPPPRRPRCQ